MNAHRRHDLSDETWALLEAHLPGRAGAWAATREITDCLSMQFCGFCARARLGEICRHIFRKQSGNITGVGPQRIVAGKGGEMYYTPDHYKTFIKVK